MNAVNHLFQDEDVAIEENLIRVSSNSAFTNQEQTNQVFSEKWGEVNKEEEDVEKMIDMQLKWYLKLYGFSSNDDLAAFLCRQNVILDAGCGLGYKAAWFATLAPDSTVIGMDFSEAAILAANRYKHIKNLFFVRGDIANTPLKKGSIGYVSCDQVIHHTEKPAETFKHLASLLAPGGELACYVYAKKALPRELVDDYFREYSKKLTHQQLWELSEQLTELGKNLTKLKASFHCPDIPALGIKGGEYDVQRFLYWNFLKCFWREDSSDKLSVATNFDWYAPSNAARYSLEEFNQWGIDNKLEKVFSHSEEACHTGRFKKK